MALLGVVGIMIFLIMFVVYYLIALGDDLILTKFNDLNMFPEDAM